MPAFCKSLSPGMVGLSLPDFLRSAAWCLFTCLASTQPHTSGLLLGCGVLGREGSTWNGKCCSHVSPAWIPVSLERPTQPGSLEGAGQGSRAPGHFGTLGLCAQFRGASSPPALLLSAGLLLGIYRYLSLGLTVMTGLWQGLEGILESKLHLFLLPCLFRASVDIWTSYGWWWTQRGF